MLTYLQSRRIMKQMAKLVKMQSDTMTNIFSMYSTREEKKKNPIFAADQLYKNNVNSNQLRFHVNVLRLEITYTFKLVLTFKFLMIRFNFHKVFLP